MITHKFWLGFVLCAFALSACAASNEKDDVDTAEEGGTMQAPEGPACFASSVSVELATQR